MIGLIGLLTPHMALLVTRLGEVSAGSMELHLELCHGSMVHVLGISFATFPGITRVQDGNQSTQSSNYISLCP